MLVARAHCNASERAQGVRYYIDRNVAADSGAREPSRYSIALLPARRRRTHEKRTTASRAPLARSLASRQARSLQTRPVAAAAELCAARN